MKLRNAGSTNPMEPAQKKFNGKKASRASHGPKRPHQGGSSYAQLSIKIEKLKTVQQENEACYQYKEA